MPKQMHAVHEHPLSVRSTFNKLSCKICNGWSGNEYWCEECGFTMHKDCADRYFSKPFLCNHFLKVLSPEDGRANNRCYFSRERFEELPDVPKSRIVHCTICNISTTLGYLSHLPPLTIFQPKHHKHSLTLLLRVVTFTCNACGREGDRNPYVCLECNFMVHRKCTHLPRVISINRHDHRISHTFHLGEREGDWKCGVCRKTIDWVYGAFKCSRCPSYAIHSKCATRKEVWDGIELEDVPEEEEEIEDPFKVLNEKDIIHFSHEQHILRLDENYVMENDNMRCGGCVLSINGDPCYKCVECDFCLHKSCASLPRKKRHLLHNHKLTLQVDDDKASIFECKACQTMSNGFMYDCREDLCRDYSGSDRKYDVRCSSVSEPFHHDLHPHPLYWTLERSKQCKACDKKVRHPLSCMDCEYALCMTCTTLPRKVKHRCDDHYLSLRQGTGNSSGDLWCDICETKTDPSVCYYTCDECGVCLHVNCVLGDLYYMKVGHMHPDLELLPNNGATRPLCIGCGVRCKFPFLMRRTTEEFVDYICSMDCFINV